MCSVSSQSIKNISVQVWCSIKTFCFAFDESHFYFFIRRWVWTWRKWCIMQVAWNIKLNEKNIRKLVLSAVQNLLHCEALFVLLLIHIADDITLTKLTKTKNSIFYSILSISKAAATTPARHSYWYKMIYFDSCFHASKECSISISSSELFFRKVIWQ